MYSKHVYNCTKSKKDVLSHTQKLEPNPRYKWLPHSHLKQEVYKYFEDYKILSVIFLHNMNPFSQTQSHMSLWHL